MASFFHLPVEPAEHPQVVRVGIEFKAFVSKLVHVYVEACAQEEQLQIQKEGTHEEQFARRERGRAHESGSRCRSAGAEYGTDSGCRWLGGFGVLLGWRASYRPAGDVSYVSRHGQGSQSLVRSWRSSCAGSLMWPPLLA